MKNSNKHFKLYFNVKKLRRIAICEAAATAMLDRVNSNKNQDPELKNNRVVS